MASGNTGRALQHSRRSCLTCAWSLGFWRDVVDGITLVSPVFAQSGVSLRGVGATKGV